MTEHEQIEQQIRNVLATETHAIPLSNRLFAPDGLFAQLGQTEEQRRQVAQAPLFKQALQRLSELEQQEITEFGRVVRQAQTLTREGGYLFKLERT